MKIASLCPIKTLEWMRRSFDAFPERGVLVWRVPPPKHPRLAGTEAGTFRATHTGKKYCHIKCDGQPVKRGYLIFLWVNGRWPAPSLDHRSGDSTDDSIGNIREATATENAWNHKKRRRRIKLPMGVRSMASGRFEARIAVNKKMLHLGSFETPELASAAYQTKRKELFHEFA